MARPAPSFEIATTPSGIQIAYYDKAHRYKIGTATDSPLLGDGYVEADPRSHGKLRWVPSASGILDALPKSLTGWGERLGVEGVLAILSRTERPVGSWNVDAMLLELKRCNLRWWQVREKAALQGTDVHEVFEQLSLGTPPRMSDIPLAKRGFIQGMCKWWVDYDPAVKHAELMVASWDHQYAGRMDLLAETENEDGVIDLKTSRAIRDSHHFQTAGYVQGVNESGYGPVKKGHVLRVTPEGSYEFVESWATPEQFLAIKGSYDAIKAFEKATPEEHKKKAA